MESGFFRIGQSSYWLIEGSLHFDQSSIMFSKLQSQLRIPGECAPSLLSSQSIAEAGRSEKGTGVSVGALLEAEKGAQVTIGERASVTIVGDSTFTGGAFTIGDGANATLLGATSTSNGASLILGENAKMVTVGVSLNLFDTLSIGDHSLVVIDLTVHGPSFKSCLVFSECILPAFTNVTILNINDAKSLCGLTCVGAGVGLVK